MNDYEMLMINCEHCASLITLDEVIGFSPENNSRTLRLCEQCYELLDNKHQQHRDENQL